MNKNHLFPSLSTKSKHWPTKTILKIFVLYQKNFNALAIFNELIVGTSFYINYSDIGSSFAFVG
jgi:hypothetical protein